MHLCGSVRRFRHFRLCGAGEAFDPVLVIAVEGTGMLSPEFLEEKGTLLRFLGQHVTAIVRRRDYPAVVSARTGFVAVDYGLPRELLKGSYSVTLRLIGNPTVTRLYLTPSDSSPCGMGAVGSSAMELMNGQPRCEIAGNPGA
jgi:hypothetical protein